MNEIIVVYWTKFVLLPLEQPVAMFFGMLMVVSFAFGILSKKIRPISSNICATLGIIGTFVGIYLGLIDFDVNDIDSSVPTLLEGMKIAFSTSIWGMFLATAMKVFVIVSQEKITESDVGPKILDELKNLRNENKDHHRELYTELRSFLNNVVDGNNKALIAALEEVIRDFNTKISEQFGENFKHLNDAMGKILEWQENNKEQVAWLTKAFNHVVESFQGMRESQETITHSLAEVATNTSSITQTMSDLQSVVGELGKQQKSFEETLEAVSSLKESAVTAFPVIEDNIKILTEEFSKVVKDNSEAISDSVEKLEHGLEESFKLFNDQMQKEVTEAINIMGGHLASLSEKFVDDYTPLTERLREVVRLADDR